MSKNEVSVEVTSVEMPIKAKHVAAKLGMKPTSLRRVLRAMPQYADGVHTNYAWPSLECKAVKEIEARVKTMQAEKQARAEAAKAALAARAATLAAAAKADAAIAK